MPPPTAHTGSFLGSFHSRTRHPPRTPYSGLAAAPAARAPHLDTVSPLVGSPSPWPCARTFCPGPGGLLPSLLAPCRSSAWLVSHGLAPRSYMLGASRQLPCDAPLRTCRAALPLVMASGAIQSSSGVGASRTCGSSSSIGSRRRNCWLQDYLQLEQRHHHRRRRRRGRHRRQPGRRRRRRRRRRNGTARLSYGLSCRRYDPLRAVCPCSQLQSSLVGHDRQQHQRQRLRAQMVGLL